MSAAVTLIALAYALLGGLLLSLNLRAAWDWRVKAIAIVVTAVVAIGLVGAVHALLGWPTAAAPPAAFRLLAVQVVEPDRRNGEAGAIRLWLVEGDRPPRAHALPYDRALHRALAGLQSVLDEGGEIEGRRHRDGTTTLPFGLELHALAPGRAPSKDD